MKLKKLVAVMMAVTMFGAVLTGCGASAGASSSANSQDTTSTEGVIKFKMALIDNEASNYYKGAMKIAEEVKEATDGKIEIEVVAGGALGGERDTVELAMSGDIDIATAANSVLTNWIPEMGILDQAFLWDNEGQAHAAVDGALGDLIEEKAEALGLHVIGYMESGFRNVFSKKPIDEIADFKGIKIRTMQNEYHMTAFEAFGAMPTSMASNEQFTALQQGSIDAVENAVSNCLANGFYDVTKNITMTNHAFVYIVMTMSDKAWNKIPEELKEDFVAGVKRGYEAQRQYLVEANEAAVAELQTLGVEIHEIDNAALKAAYQEAAAKKNYQFDPVWQAAVDEAIASAQ